MGGIWYENFAGKQLTKIYGSGAGENEVHVLTASTPGR